MRGLSAFAAWLTLLAVVGVEILAARMFGTGFTAAMGGIAAALVVVMTFMGLPSAPRLGAVFAVGGLFWLGILLGLGSLDPATRQQTRVELRTASGIPQPANANLLGSWR